MRILITALYIPTLLVAATTCMTSNARVPSANPMETSRPFPAGPSRQLENYRFLEDPARRIDPLDGWRYHSLGESSWLQLGGELRYAFTSADNVAFDLFGTADDNYIQQRAQAHASLHLFENRVRAFVQLQNTRSWNQDLPIPRDASRTDVAQAFLDIHFTLGQLQGNTRLGRQEIQYGQGALLNIGEQPNVRQAFDGAVLSLKSRRSHQFDLLVLRPISYDVDNFDDSSDNNVQLLIAYASLALAPQRGIDIYGFGREMKEREFQGFTGKEERYTVGTRLFGSYQRLDWNWDLMLQGGDHAKRDIRAWGIRSDSGYTFDNPTRLRIGMHLDIASGGDPLSASTTRTFDALYPRNGTYGEANVTTMSNLMLAGPSLRFFLARNIEVIASIMRTWRHSTDDYVYLPGVLPMTATLNNMEREIGTTYQFTGRWQPTPNFNIDLHGMHLAAGRAITEAGGNDINTVVMRTAVRF